MKALLLSFLLGLCCLAQAQTIPDYPDESSPADDDYMYLWDTSTNSLNKVSKLNLQTSIKIGGAAGVQATATNGVLRLLGFGDGQDEDLTLDFNTTANTVALASTTGVGTLNLGSIGITTSGTFSASTGSVTTFRILDGVDQSHGMQIAVGSDLTANRILTVNTGDANRSITLTGDFAMSGAFNLTHTITGNTNVTYPTSGTLATVGGALGAATATTAAANTSTTQVATTAFVQQERAVVIKVVTGDYTVGTTDTRELQGGILYVTNAATLTIPAVASGVHFTVITDGAVAVSIDPNASDKIFLNGTALSDGDKITNASTAGDTAVISYRSADGWWATTNSGWTDGN